MASTLSGGGEGGGVRKNEMVSDVEGGGLASILNVHPLFFYY